MRAAWFAGAGDAGVIEFRDVPRPAPQPLELLVRVEAAGLNRADIMQRRGAYPSPPGWPAEIPGLEYAGVVEAVGQKVTRWRPGDRVMGLVGGGAMAEYVVVREFEALAVPPGMPSPEAAAIPEAFLTAWDALVHRARLTRGERVLWHAAASGVGTAAVQLCRQLDVHCVGTSRSAGKLARLAALGLHEGIDTSVRPFREALAEPVHAIVDSLGGGALADNLALLHPKGRLVVLGLLQGSRGELDLGLVLRRRLEIVGTAMRSRSFAERVPLVAEFAERVLPAFVPDNGRPALVPVVDAVLPMEQLAEAHRRMERNETFGKLVLSW